MPKPKQNNKNILNSPVLAVCLVVGLCLLGFVIVTSNSRQANNNQETIINDEDFEVTQATPEEQAAAEEHKTNLPDANKTTSDTNGGAGEAKPIITSADQFGDNIEVSSRVPGVFENSGLCTLKLTKGAQSASASKQAEPNVSEMSCGYISIPVSQLSPGEWQAIISYSSSTATGISSPTTVEVK